MSKVKTDAIETRAGGTSVLTIGTSTQTIKLPGGTPGADKVLKSDASGNATWGTDVGGALVHLHTSEVDAVVSEIQVNDVFSATYMNYRIVFNNIVPDTDNNTVYLGFKETSVATQLNMNSITRNFGVTSAGATAYGDSTEYNMGGQELTKTASADGGLNGWIEVYVPFASGGSNWTRTTYAFMNYNPGDTSWSHTYGAAQATTTVSTPCFRVFSSGNMGDATITGYIRVYGYKDS